MRSLFQEDKCRRPSMALAMKSAFDVLGKRPPKAAAPAKRAAVAKKGKDTSQRLLFQVMPGTDVRERLKETYELKEARVARALREKEQAARAGRTKERAPLDYERFEGHERYEPTAAELRSSPYNAFRVAEEAWRPGAPRQRLVLYVTEFEYNVRPPEAPEVFVCGVTEDSTSVLLRAVGFYPYLYAGVPETWVEACDADELETLCARWYAHFTRAVESEVARDARLRAKTADGRVFVAKKPPFVVDGAVDIKGFRGQGVFVPLVKLAVVHPAFVPLVKRFLFHPRGYGLDACPLCDDDGGEWTSPYMDGSEPALPEWYLARESRVRFHERTRHGRFCRAVFHGGCLRQWMRASYVRGELQRDSNALFHCPVCTSEVFAVAEASAPLEDSEERNRPLPNWFDEFQRTEVAFRSFFVPVPEPTEIEGLCRAIRCREHGTRAPPARMTAYEANVDFTNRFWLDERVFPLRWVVVDKHYDVPAADRASTKTVELMCAYNAIRLLKEVEPDNPLAEAEGPLKVCCCDLEMRPGPGGAFPVPTKDPVLQAGFLNYNTATQEMCSVIMTLGDLAEDPAADESTGVVTRVYSFADEATLLYNIYMFVRVTGPDVFYGWNIPFDVSYYYLRCRQLGLLCGRTFCSQLRGRDVSWSRGAIKQRAIIKVKTPGMTIFDGLIHAFDRLPGLPSYGLDAVSAAVLKLRKVAMSHKMIPVLQETAEGRATLAEYLQGDIFLTLLVALEKNFFLDLTVAARAMCTTLTVAHQFGTQRQLMSLLRYFAQEERNDWGADYRLGVIPCNIPMERDPTLGTDDVKYEGAVVLPPLAGMYAGEISAVNAYVPPGEVVATADFASLYPSIMETENYSSDTLIPPEMRTRLKLTKAEYSQAPDRSYDTGRTVETPNPDNPMFARHGVRTGIFTAVIRYLKRMRSAAKAQMKIYSDRIYNVVVLGREDPELTLRQLKALEAYWDVVQNGWKRVMNSLYGFTGLSPEKGQMAQPQIASSVTGTGRHAIMNAKFEGEDLVAPANGFPAGMRLEVIYGDTDSNFMHTVGDLLFSNSPILAMAFYDYLCRYITRKLSGVMELAFEKIYWWFIVMMGKKSYIGQKMMPDGSVSVDTKGHASKRRDSTLLQKEVTKRCLECLLRGDLPSMIAAVGDCVVDVWRRRLPMYKAASTGSYSGDMHTYTGSPSKAMAAARRLYAHNGTHIPAGERFAFIVAEPAAKERRGPCHTASKDLEVMIRTSLGVPTPDPVTARVYEISHAVDIGVRYDRVHIIKGVITVALKLLKFVAMAMYKIDMEAAERKLVYTWLSDPRLRVQAASNIRDTASGTLEAMGLRRLPRCVLCNKLSGRADPPAPEPASCSMAPVPGGFRVTIKGATALRSSRKVLCEPCESANRTKTLAKVDAITDAYRRRVAACGCNGDHPVLTAIAAHRDAYVYRPFPDTICYEQELEGSCVRLVPNAPETEGSCVNLVPDAKKDRSFVDRYIDGVYCDYLAAVEVATARDPAINTNCRQHLLECRNTFVERPFVPLGEVDAAFLHCVRSKCTLLPLEARRAVVEDATDAASDRSEEEADAIRAHLRAFVADAVDAWNSCRSCSGAKMRGKSTILECTSTSCSIWGRRNHSVSSVAGVFSDVHALEW